MTLHVGAKAGTQHPELLCSGHNKN